jgi:hypothetical protein
MQAPSTVPKNSTGIINVPSRILQVKVGKAKGKTAPEKVEIFLLTGEVQDYSFISRNLCQPDDSIL